MIRQGIQRWNLRFGLGVPPSEGRREALQWLMFARLAVLYFLLAILILSQLFRQNSIIGQQIYFGYLLLSISFFFNFFQASIVEKMPARDWVPIAHILFDAVMTSCWLLFTGGKESLFALLYVIHILVVSQILYQKGAFFAAVVSSAAFLTVVLQRADSFPTPYLTWGVYSVIFLSVGLVGGYLSEELSRTNQSLKDEKRRSEKLIQLHESIVTNMPTGLLTVDREMRVNFINSAGAQIIGKPISRITGFPLEQVESGLLPFFVQIETENVVDDESPLDTDTALSATGKESHRSFFVQTKLGKGGARLQQRVEIGAGNLMRIIRGDVAELDPVAGLGRLLDQQATGGRVLLFQDVTKLLHLEEKVKQNEKLAAVGQLAAGIAHEIRNPLASMSASIEMLKGSYPAGDHPHENQKLMDIAIREIDRLNRLISEFLDFVKPEKLKLSAVSLPALIAEVILSTKQIKDKKVAIEIVEKVETSVVAHAHAEKIRQVLLNLVINAIQSMTLPGKIEIGAAEVSAQRVKFWVADEGTGMTEAALAHLYEPFFTTKEKGTGLGLATAYKIVEAHHGEIRVESVLKRGTRFEVFLPKA